MSEKAGHITLSIAGFDPSGGAGVLADVQTFQQCGVQGMAVVTAITNQDEDEVFGVEWESSDSIKKQLEPIIKRYSIDTVKIGIVENLNVLNGIVDFVLGHLPQVRIIWDPVMSASSGFGFTETKNGKLLRSILEKIYLVTPNRDEYEKLINALDDQIISSNVLLKGGHSDNNDTSDRLLTDTGKLEIIVGSRIQGVGKHGTGCVLSSVIAARLTFGDDLKSACQFGKQYIEKYLLTGEGRLGRHFEIKM